jgi:hypothetical protein
MIPSVLPKNVLGLCPDLIAVTDNSQPWLDVIEKYQRSSKIATITKQGDSFANDIPGRAKSSPEQGSFGDTMAWART